MDRACPLNLNPLNPEASGLEKAVRTRVFNFDFERKKKL